MYSSTKCGVVVTTEAVRKMCCMFHVYLRRPEVLDELLCCSFQQRTWIDATDLSCLPVHIQYDVALKTRICLLTQQSSERTVADVRTVYRFICQSHMSQKLSCKGNNTEAHLYKFYLSSLHNSLICAVLVTHHEFLTVSNCGLWWCLIH